MHIAHSRNGGLTVEEVAKLAGLKRRQVAYLATAGEIPGAKLSRNGYHFEYPDTPELRTWAKSRRRLARERKRTFKAPRLFDRVYIAKWDDDMQLPRRIARAFTDWKLWMYQHKPLSGWKAEKLEALQSELATFDEAYQSVRRLVDYHRKERTREILARLKNTL